MGRRELEEELGEVGGLRGAEKENRENGERKNERKGGKAREREMEEKEGTHKVDGLEKV